MPDYILAYHGGRKPESPEAGAQQMAKWKACLGGLGVVVVNPGTPLGPSRIVSAGGISDDGGPNPLTGFSIVRADTSRPPWRSPEPARSSRSAPSRWRK